MEKATRDLELGLKRDIAVNLGPQDAQVPEGAVGSPVTHGGGWVSVSTGMQTACHSVGAMLSHSSGEARGLLSRVYRLTQSLPPDAPNSLKRRCRHCHLNLSGAC